MWFAVTHNPTAEWLARQITEAFPWGSAPKYLIRDNDRAFGAVFKARVRAMGIRDRPTSFRSPWQNGYVERLIGSIRRECTDRLIVFNAEHLRRILAKYSAYYNEMRVHVSLGKDAPCPVPSSGSERLLRIRSSAAYTIDTLESSFRKGQRSGPQRCGRVRQWRATLSCLHTLVDPPVTRRGDLIGNRHERRKAKSLARKK
jgi:hypothetical protein